MTEIMTLSAGEPETRPSDVPGGLYNGIRSRPGLRRTTWLRRMNFWRLLETIDVSSYPFLGELAGTSRDHRLDGYLFPDTYEFDVKANVEDVIYKMLNRFNELYLPAYYEKSETIVSRRIRLSSWLRL